MFFRFASKLVESQRWSAGFWYFWVALIIWAAAVVGGVLGCQATCGS